jgi:hypothetical protein
MYVPQNSRDVPSYTATQRRFSSGVMKESGIFVKVDLAVKLSSPGRKKRYYLLGLLGMLLLVYYSQASWQVADLARLSAPIVCYIAVGPNNRPAICWDAA